MKDALIAGPLPATVLALTLKVYSVEGFKSDTSLEVAYPPVAGMLVVVSGPSTSML